MVEGLAGFEAEASGGLFKQFGHVLQVFFYERLGFDGLFSCLFGQFGQTVGQVVARDLLDVDFTHWVILLH